MHVDANQFQAQRVKVLKEEWKRLSVLWNGWNFSHQDLRLPASTVLELDRLTASQPPQHLSLDQAYHKRLSAIHSFPNWKGRHRFLLHLGKLPFQHSPDEAASRVSLLFQVIELGFEIHG
jgi:hypothetical protein